MWILQLMFYSVENLLLVLILFKMSCRTSFSWDISFNFMWVIWKSVLSVKPCFPIAPCPQLLPMVFLPFVWYASLLTVFNLILFSLLFLHVQNFLKMCMYHLLFVMLLFRVIIFNLSLVSCFLWYLIFFMFFFSTAWKS